MTDLESIEVPLIYTSRGNLPISELEYKYAWEDTEEYTKFSEAWFLGDELVKNNCHVFSKVPIPGVGVEQASLI